MWISHLNGSYRDEEGFEISVAIEGSHGTRSWGWPGTDKIIVLDGTRYDYTKKEYEQAKLRAKCIASALNPSRM